MQVSQLYELIEINNSLTGVSITMNGSNDTELTIGNSKCNVGLCHFTVGDNV